MMSLKLVATWLRRGCHMVATEENERAKYTLAGAMG